MDIKYIKISTTALGEKSTRELFLAAFLFTEYIIKVLKVPMVYRVVDPYSTSQVSISRMLLFIRYLSMFSIESLVSRHFR
jgi:hypothetical protein